MTATDETPRLSDVCKDCTFLGSSGIYDLYWCDDYSEPVARYTGEDRHDVLENRTGWDFAKAPILAEAFQRALAAGVVVDERAVQGLACLHTWELIYGKG